MITASYPVPEAPDTGFVSPDGYGTPDIICHDSATAAGVSVPVEAGSTVDLVCMIFFYVNRWRTTICETFVFGTK